MNVEIDASAPKTDRADIRRHARGFSVVCGCIASVFSFLSRWDVVLAVCIGIAAALCGFVIWSVYHHTSKRNDGLCIVLASTAWLQPLQSKNFFDLNYSILALLIVNLPLTFLFGKHMKPRASKPEKPGPDRTYPLYDCEID